MDLSSDADRAGSWKGSSQSNSKKQDDLRLSAVPNDTDNKSRSSSNKNMSDGDRMSKSRRSVKDKDTYTEKVCEEDNEDSYAIDFSMLKRLPKSIILDAIEYAKQRRREEEERQRAEKDQPKRLKCIPPWAKSYGGDRIETCVSKGTQYEQTIYVPEHEYFEGDEEGEGDEYSYLKSLEHHGKGKHMDHIDVISTTSGESFGVQVQPETTPFAMQTDDDTMMLSEGSEEYEQTSSKQDLEGKYHDLLAKEMSSKDELGLSETSSKQLRQTSSRLMSSRDTPSKDRVKVGSRMESSYKKSFLGRKDRNLQDIDLTQLSSEERIRYLTEQTDELLALEGEKQRKTWLEGESEFEDEELQLEEHEIKNEEELDTMKTVSKDTAYLKQHLGHILPKLLAEVAWKQPIDPVHYLAHRLYCERRQQQIRDQMVCMRAALKHEREALLDAGEEEAIKTFGYVDRKRTHINVTDMYDALEFEEMEEDNEEQLEEMSEESPEA